ALAAGAAATAACLDALGVGRTDGARPQDAWALLAACLGGSVVSVLVQAGLGETRALSPDLAPAELVRALAGSFVLLAAAHRVPGLVGQGARGADDAAAGETTSGPVEAVAVWLGGLGALCLVFVALDGVPVAFSTFPVAVWAALRLP
ncbi:hypothetical protein, partial [Streptomyces sp. NP160]|uniref:hypothetical protein n=1 Tax=Streptomyces sp. NP160 TaxID=2586637 RepID=UPI001C58AF2E